MEADKRRALRLSVDALTAALGEWDLPAIVEISTLPLRAADALDTIFRLDGATPAGAHLETAEFPNLDDDADDVTVRMRLRYRHTHPERSSREACEGLLTATRWHWTDSRWLLSDYQENDRWQRQQTCLHPQGGVQLSRLKIQPLSFRRFLNTGMVVIDLRLGNQSFVAHDFEFYGNGQSLGTPFRVGSGQFKLVRLSVPADPVALSVRIRGPLVRHLPVRRRALTISPPPGHPGDDEWCEGVIAAVETLSKISDGAGAKFAKLFSR